MRETNRRKRLIYFAPLIIVGLAFFATMGGLIVRQLWNWLLPAIFGVRAITFWQALGLLTLSRILFGGISGHGMPRGNFRRRMAERWERMTPEERERFREGMRGRCGMEPEAGQTGEV